MGTNRQVRSPSPTPSNKHRSSDEIERKEQPLETDESEGLLPGREGAGDHGGGDGARALYSKWPCFGLYSLAGIVLLSLAATLVAPFSAVASERNAVQEFGRPSADYIVPDDWDMKAPPEARYHRWTITDITANPDGVFRPMTVINGKFPGPMIVANEGDTIVVDVINHAKNATAIHWHGILQNGTNFMDGAVGVTQCPIAPGHSFRYRFTVKGQAGTYFYHSHQAAQGLDGLYGPLIILSSQERQAQAYQYDTDRVVMVQDWYHEPSPGLLRQALAPGSESPPIPDGVLINGRNKVDCSQHPDRHCDNPATPFATFDLAPDSRHRLRIINVGGIGWLEVSADKHLELPITEVDGVAVEPHIDSTVLVGPGQRYSVQLRTDQQQYSGLFWLRARLMTHCFSETVLPQRPGAVIEATAVLRYGRGRDEPRVDGTHAVLLPETTADSGKFSIVCKDAAPGTYQPRPRMAAPAHAHYSWYFRVNLAIGAWRLQRGFLNQSTFRPQLQAPTLHRLVSDGGDAAFDPTHELVISSDEAEVVDIVLQNFDEGAHPFHLHGAQMFVLAAGHGYFPGYAALGFRPEGKGLLRPAPPGGRRRGDGARGAALVANPTRRDVATVESFGWTLVRFVADNPGVWLFHCHVVWHAAAGMGVLFAARRGLVRNWMVPTANARLCAAPLGELEKGAAPKDEIWVGNFG